MGDGTNHSIIDDAVLLHERQGSGQVKLPEPFDKGIGRDAFLTEVLYRAFDRLTSRRRKWRRAIIRYGCHGCLQWCQRMSGRATIVRFVVNCLKEKKLETRMYSSERELKFSRSEGLGDLVSSMIAWKPDVRIQEV